jgi:hypothetical protein
MGTHLVYVIGVPGAGKTTLVRAALAGWHRVPVASSVPHEQMVTPAGVTVGAHLGVDRAPFGGTDTLSMSIQPKAVAWLAALHYRVVLGEGDRLGTASFFAAAAALPGVRLTVVLLDCPPVLAAARRAGRTPAAQDPVWVAGRMTKVARLAAAADVHLDATRPAAALAGELRALLLDAAVPA